MPLLPFSHILRHPTKDQVVLAYGEHIQVVDTKTGVIVSSTADLEEREAGGVQVEPLTNTPDVEKANKARVQQIAISPDGAFLATAADDKVMKIWDTESWKCLGTRTLMRRSNALQFTKDGSHVVTADKFGDIYNMERDIPDVPEKAPKTAEKTDGEAEGEGEGEGEDEDEGEQPILGHVSMATDLELTPDNKYIITADRDEHIRVSQFPKGHNIETYCLGHTSFVTEIRVLPGANYQYLISGAGDATIRVWDFMKGKKVQTFSVREALGMPPSDPNSEEDDVTVYSLAINESKNHIVAVIEKEPKILILQWDSTAAKIEVHKVLEIQGQALAADFDRSGKLWVSSVIEDNTTGHLAVYDEESYTLQEDLAKYVNTFGSKIVETLPDLYSTEELRKHTTDWRDLKKAREEKEAARRANDPDAPPTKKKRTNKNSRKIPESAASTSSAAPAEADSSAMQE
ncbi:tRNA (guanine-N(7)-)-methyltransferase non-catalytic subunit trm82 [Gryganskiella cystojenkinii]|nr:tRNA (guanine-N(7)-)-methyltransferase non-catalytic subunit trm82 [Gryganskiella cystojenkinii]